MSSDLLQHFAPSVDPWVLFLLTHSSRCQLHSHSHSAHKTVPALIPLTGRAEDSFCALDFFASLIFVQLGGGWLSSNNFLCNSTVCFTPPIRTRKKKICDWDFIAYSAWDTPILSNYFPLVHVPLFLLCKKPLQDFNSVSLEIKISRVTSKPTEESSIKCSPCVL